jgi:hypothetical protein
MTAPDDLDGVNREDLDAVGYRRAGDDGWSAKSIEREINQGAPRAKALPPAEPRRRIRKPSLES